MANKKENDVVADEVVEVTAVVETTKATGTTGAEVVDTVTGETFNDAESEDAGAGLRLNLFGWWKNATWATRVTYMRLALIPFIMLFYIGSFTFVASDFFWQYGRLVALLLFVVAAMTDYLDGWIARKFNQITDAGKLLDPIMDKLLLLAGLILIAVDPILYTQFEPISVIPHYAAIIVLFVAIGRDLVVSGIRQMALQKGITFAADNLGKIKTALYMIAIGLFMFYAINIALDDAIFGIGLFADIFRYVTWAIMITASVLSVISAVNYAIKYSRAKTEHDNN